MLSHLVSLFVCFSWLGLLMLKKSWMPVKQLVMWLRLNCFWRTIKTCAMTFAPTRTSAFNSLLYILFIRLMFNYWSNVFTFFISFDSLAGLASKLPKNKEVREKAQQLDEERRALQRGWQQKDDFLRQTFDLQIFNKEADQIDAASSSHEAFLEFFDLGVRIETFL